MKKIFPVDGQHRVEGIKAVLKTNPELSNEKVPVIFIGHRRDLEGMQRARRLFSTLNRYAKPVSLSDIIALDEDDVVAIATRDLLENHPLFEDKRIIITKQKAIPDRNKVAFTSIITLYECNFELLNLFLKDKIVKKETKTLKGRSKAKQYCRFRPSDAEIEEFRQLCFDFWDSFVEKIEVIQDYLTILPEDNPANRFRNKLGGNLLFRPIGLKPFVFAAINLKEFYNADFKFTFTLMNNINLNIGETPWKNVVWNEASKRMISSPNTILLSSMLMYFVNKNSLSQKEQEKLFKEYSAALALIEDDETAKETLNESCINNL
jgi:DNA sulfur modification protein DndB